MLSRQPYLRPSDNMNQEGGDDGNVKSALLKQLLLKPWFLLGALSLACCFASRNAFDITEILHPSRYSFFAIILLQVSRILPLLLVLWLYRRDAEASRNFRPILVTHPLRLLAIASFESLGMGFLFLSDHNMTFFLGILRFDSLLFGIGNSFLLVAIAEFFLVLERPKALIGLAVALVLTSFTELALTIIQADISSIVRIILPFVACFLIIEANRQLKSDDEETARLKIEPDISVSLSSHCEPANQTSSVKKGQEHERVVATPTKRNFRILLVSVACYVLIFRTLRTSWSFGADETSSFVLTINLSAVLGLLLAGILVYALTDISRPDGNSIPISPVLVPLIMASLYLSTFLSDSVAFIYVLSVFAARKLIVFLIWNTALLFSKRRQRMRVFILGIISLELGFFAYFILKEAFNFFSIPESTVMPVIVVVLLAVMLTRDLFVWFTEIKKQSPDIGDKDEETFGALQQDYQLTAREAEVLVYLASGRNAEYIANKLVIAQTTAKSHISHIYQKMQINSQQQLMDIVEDKRTHLMSEKI